MAEVSIRYSTGSLISQSTSLGVDSLPLRGKGALGGRMAISGPIGVPGKYLYYLDGNEYGISYIWNDITAAQNLNEVSMYRCLYLRVDSGIIYNPKIYIGNQPYVDWKFKIATTKNTECGHIIASELTAPADAGADSLWRSANGQGESIDLLAADQALGQGEYIYFWVKRTASKEITSGNLVTERFNITIRGEE